MKSGLLLRREPITGLLLAACTGALILILSVGASAQGGADPADLRLTKSDSPDPVVRGNVLTYTIRVRNLGPDPATATVVEDRLPGGVSFLSVATDTGSCAQQAKTVTCTLGELASLAEATITIRTRVTKRKGTIRNTATVESTTPDPVAANNQDTERTTVRLRPRPTGPTCQGAVATIVGTPGNDVLVGTAGRDVILARAGHDRVFARGGRDLVCAGRGFDLVRGGPRADSIRGGLKADRLIGGGGNDVLRGGRGRDRLRGGFGADLLAGGLGIDFCRGGPGRDTLRSCER